MSKDKRGYRSCVRVLVLDGDKVILGKHNEQANWTIPGGGVEEDQTLEEACINEVLEECSVLITDVKQLGVYFKYLKEYKDPERAKLYKGAEDTWFKAKYKTKVRRKAVDDSLNWQWFTYEEAVKAIESNSKDNIFTEPTLNALKVAFNKI